MTPVVTRPARAWAPLVASIPHGGEQVPPEMLDMLLVEMDRNYADWYTSALYRFLPDLGVPTVVATAHRLVADPNRAPTEPLAAPWPTAVVATTSTRDEALYAEPLSDADVQTRVAVAHTSYHDALDSLVTEAQSRFPAVVLLDLHSFGMPLGVDVVLGDRHGATAAPHVMHTIEESFRAHGFSTRRNQPFAGGWIIRRLAGHPRVHALQLELNQRLYVDPVEIDRDDWRRPSLDVRRLHQASRRLRGVLATIVDRLGTIEPRR